MQVYRIDCGDPNDFVTAQYPAICYTKAGGLWTKVNDNNDSVGWLEIIKDDSRLVP